MFVWAIFYKSTHITMYFDYRFMFDCGISIGSIESELFLFFSDCQWINRSFDSVDTFLKSICLSSTIRRAVTYQYGFDRTLNRRKKAYTQAHAPHYIGSWCYICLDFRSTQTFARIQPNYKPICGLNELIESYFSKFVLYCSAQLNR